MLIREVEGANDEGTEPSAGDTAAQPDTDFRDELAELEKDLLPENMTIVEDAFTMALEDHEEFEANIEAVEEYRATDAQSKEKECKAVWNAIDEEHRDALQAIITRAGCPDDLEVGHDDFSLKFKLKPRDLEIWPQDKPEVEEQLQEAKRALKRLLNKTFRMISTHRQCHLAHAARLGCTNT